MINNLLLILSLSFIKFLMEDSLLLILMTMEMISTLTFFTVLGLNPELGLKSCTITMLTIMISESVLSLGIFVSLIRSSGKEKVVSLSLSY